jgi:asparagine synthase (glutamine-hydrolysing)
LEGGKQPLGNEDGSVQVVFNGEIYNYRELRQQLEGRGHRFATQSDTEILVHLYEDAGDRLVEQLRGMFAFALWDERKKRLLLARDRVGIKPLYFLQDDEKLLFSSEIKGILAYEGVSRQIDTSSLENYLAYGMVSGTRTIFRGIEKLAPGHVLSVEPGRWNSLPRRYWQLDFSPDDTLTEEQWKEAVRAKVEESVKRHLIADVPVGAFLSGGIDSTIITAMAAQRQHQPIQTFSIGFRENQFNELPYARQVAQQYGTRHVEEVVTADAASLLDKLCWHYDEPFADSSAIPTMLVSRLASQHVKVVLSGDGGDEAFGGYSRYPHDLREGRFRNILPAWLRTGILKPLAEAWPKSDWLPRYMRAKTTLTNLSLDADAAYANTLSSCRLPLRRQLLSGDVVRQLNGHRPETMLRQAFQEGKGDPLACMLSADFATFLPDDYLVKVDRASMAYGLEVRPPLLDHELMEMSARIPSRFKIHEGETKWIFKQACDDLLPQGLRKRPKQGFEVPVDSWLRGPLQEMFRETVLNPSGPAAPLLDLRQVEVALDQHVSGRSRLGQALWSLLVLTRWAELFLGPTVFSKPQATSV